MQELAERVAAFEIVEQIPQRHPRSAEHDSAAENLGIRVDNASGASRHDVILRPSQSEIEIDRRSAATLLERDADS